MFQSGLAVAVCVLGLIAWAGQTCALVAPRLAARLTLTEAEDEVDGSLHLFERFALGVPDVLLTWIVPASALMMLLGVPYWPVFALIGAGIYLYFPIVFSIARVVLKADGRKVGRTGSQVYAYIFGALWTASALCMIMLAIAELDSGL